MKDRPYLIDTLECSNRHLRKHPDLLNFRVHEFLETTATPKTQLYPKRRLLATTWPRRPQGHRTARIGSAAGGANFGSTQCVHVDDETGAFVRSPLVSRGLPWSP